VQQEQFEAEEDDEGEEAGTFRRASADVLATRKIIKVKRCVTFAVDILWMIGIAYEKVTPL
jgi:hypothetical protein